MKLGMPSDMVKRLKGRPSKREVLGEEGTTDGVVNLIARWSYPDESYIMKYRRGMYRVVKIEQGAGK